MSESQPQRRWFHPAPAWLVLGSLAATGFLFLSERFRWFAFNHHKGWTVLIAVAEVGVVLAVMGLWWLVAVVARWRFQFSIRTLLVLVLAVAMPFSWLAVEMKKAREQRKAINTIVQAGGFVRYDHEIAASPSCSPAPGWLRSLAGDDLCSDVAEVFIGIRVPTPSEHLNLKTGSGGVYTTSLSLSCFWGRKVEYPRISDAELGRCLENLPELQSLTLSWVDVTDAGLTQVKGLRHLKSLILTENSVITDAALDSLTGLAELQELWLMETQVTDTGLERLKELSQLKVLELRGSRVTDTGVKKLHQALPNCTIER